jgi:WD40 repeat protein
VYTFIFVFNKALNNEEEVFQSLSWKADGSVLATTSKDKKVRIWDPRANSVTHSADSHSSNRESVTTWLGASNRILTSGFDSVLKENNKIN